ncbi:MAG: hypothetical protein CMJ64_00435 [Planctomycetaceae bacterium]|nr:hypothetical protein [Planctomycetaceae bacterium]
MPIVPEIPSVVVGALLGGLFLGIGIFLGLCLGRRSAIVDVRSMSREQLQDVLTHLFQWTTGFANDVSHYRDVLARASRDFNPHKPNHTDREVTRLMSEIVNANEQLQKRLNSTESTLQQQADEIETHMSEARTDTLTDLPNRRAFDDELQRRLAEWERSNIPLAVLLLDIDHFKSFNDQYGHQAGDFVLQEVARNLRATMREAQMVARFGGEEFAIVLPDTGVHAGCQAAERARRAIERAVCRYENQTLCVTVSCGAAQAAEKESLTSLLKRADLALYASKGAMPRIGTTANAVCCSVRARAKRREMPRPLCG